jgi:hypothetical protein
VVRWAAAATEAALGGGGIAGFLSDLPVDIFRSLTDPRPSQYATWAGSRMMRFRDVFSRV